MKKYFVIGNPINHSLSPKLHNYWLKENKIDAIYDKKKIEEKNLQTIISEVKEKKINGINVTALLNGTVTLMPFIFFSLTSEIIVWRSFSSIFFLS